MKDNIKIHETALVTSSFRAQDPSLSGDAYARLWVRPEVVNFATNYTTKVSAYEPFCHCLRNRYFLDSIKSLHGNGEIDMLVNFGSGFSMYPYLLPPSLEHIEIDRPEVIAVKKDQTRKWQENDTLPRREITYFPADFNVDDFGSLSTKLKKAIGSKRTFILLEGVLFFLNREDTNRLFGLFGELQKPSGGLIGSVSYRKDIEKTDAFKRLVTFTEGTLHKNTHFEYQTIEDSFYGKLPFYNLLERKDSFGLAKKYDSQGEVLPSNDTLNEHMYLLLRQPEGR